MQNPTFRSRVVSGGFTLPVTALATSLVWILPDPTDAGLWTGLCMTLLTAYLIMELNNRHTLLRIRSRLMSSTFLLMMAVCPALHTWSLEAVPPLCLMLGYSVLFASYQLPRPEGYVFHTFLFLSAGSLCFPPMLLCCAGFYVSMLFHLRNLTWRTLTAGLLGAALPYWIYAAYAIWKNHLDTAFLYLEEWFTPRLPDFSLLTLPQWLTAGTFVFLALIASVHFVHTSYNDKIRTRLLFYVILTQEVLLFAGLAALPAHFSEMLRLFTANSALLIAHYYALTRGRFFDFWFVLSLIGLLALGGFNYLSFYL